jgi:hypothetical protein
MKMRKRIPVNDLERYNEATVTEYWRKYYINDDVPLGLCSLCGNSGFIDTTLSAISPAGIHAGRKNFCICPNGQAMRKKENERDLSS